MSKKPFEITEVNAERITDLNETGQVNKKGAWNFGEFDLKGSTIKIGVFTDANRPTAGTAGRIIFNSDSDQIQVDDGTAWTPYISGWSKVKNADVTIAAGDDTADVYQNDDDIVFPVYANEEWFFIWMPISSVNYSSAQVLTWNFVLPSGTTMRGLANSDAAVLGTMPTVSQGGFTGVGDIATFYCGIIEVGGTSGTIQLQFKKSPYDAYTATLKRGTTFLAFRAN